MNSFFHIHFCVNDSEMIGMTFPENRTALPLSYMTYPFQGTN
jgi:hypothetical protein